ncbi:hypothetical protein AYI68_g66 [Smittium mucronatum]|uniref:NADH dehydrogenase [ubiquinone] 1 beta subcomplex subunit 2 n=1 Tax=Smittium mucronatum TaxID=133383 RepID=A0A1R0H982_9FUNG|nr:hypothetical protein AYI68_g66 [Smittium mucronatum]
MAPQPPKSSPYGGYVPPKVPFFTKFWSKAIGASLFFWIMYRAKEDLPVLLKLRHPWESHGDHHSDDSEASHH